MPMRYPVTSSELHTATQATIEGLKSLRLDCCLVGSVACCAYGMSRVPNDIDMVVLTSRYTQEELKNLLVQYNSTFYLIASKDPLATYRVLWFRLAGYRRSCKVDLLLPGTMNIPSVDPSRIYRVGNTRQTDNIYFSVLSAKYPLMPFLPLLLLKLQAWQDHGESAKLFMRDKQPTDVQDILELLRLAEQNYALSDTTGITATVGSDTTQIQIKQSSLLKREEPYLPKSFIETAKTRVRKFAQMYPRSEKQWIMIGFEINSGVAFRATTRSTQSSVRRLENMMSSMALNF
ncbi:uncharacterized protein C8R40DRAFT_1086952 [Lentinula edodes]|uniref:uncharacterized protein n=1 Tax=Lentinula edodes TaxID=5353 RepID=UPI001E8D28A3|nr:uncharacterized protein C8R40DRAFT_1086952 [Lentinula edodes]KAH7878792.1 hypothetical protein C8R40DRAFT_1086952 [Lentinula edodes]